MALRLACLDWYPGFDHRHIFVRLLARALHCSIQDATCSDADVILVGPYGRSKEGISKKTNQIVIYGSGENSRPDYRFCDISMTLDLSTYGGRNVRVPAWLGEFDFWADCPDATYSYEQSQNMMETNRPLTVGDITDSQPKIAAIFSTYEQNRMSVLEALEIKLAPITKIGRLWGNAESCRDASMLFPAKHPILIRHAMNLCFENSIAPGYITEKILHARMAGCLALTYAHPSCQDDYAMAGVLNFHEFLDIDRYVSAVEELLRSPEQLHAARSAPVFAQLPDLQGIIDNLRIALSSCLRRWL
jgi:hypothetical protein